MASSVQAELGLNNSFRGGDGGKSQQPHHNRIHHFRRATNVRVVTRWRKTIYKVMLLRVKLKCYKTFVKLGVSINIAGISVAEIPYFAADWKEIKKFNLELFQSEDACKIIKFKSDFININLFRINIIKSDFVNLGLWKT